MARINGYYTIDRVEMSRQQREYEYMKERDNEESLGEEEDDPHDGECMFISDCAEYGRRCGRCRS